MYGLCSLWGMNIYSIYYWYERHVSKMLISCYSKPRSWHELLLAKLRLPLSYSSRSGSGLARHMNCIHSTGPANVQMQYWYMWISRVRQRTAISITPTVSTCRGCLSWKSIDFWYAITCVLVNMCRTLEGKCRNILKCCSLRRKVWARLILQEVGPKSALLKDASVL